MTAVQLINDLAMLISEYGDREVVIGEDSDTCTDIVAPFFIQSKDRIVIIRNKYKDNEQL